jgi:hypothetical protein
MTDLAGTDADARLADVDMDIFLETCAVLPPRTRQAIAYLIEQAIELERKGQEALAISMLETITFRLMSRRMRAVDWN